MSCGSNTRIPTYTPLTASLLFRGVRWSWKNPLPWLAGIALKWVRRSQYKELLELDDHLLSDIGISRMADERARKSKLYLLVPPSC
jgi:uncharacterized protein YjiS (DUF1127 family)